MLCRETIKLSSPCLLISKIIFANLYHVFFVGDEESCCMNKYNEYALAVKALGVLCLVRCQCQPLMLCVFLTAWNKFANTYHLQ